VQPRLLDFTYSPFVALYFAVSPGREKKCACNKCGVRVWAIDAAAVKKRFAAVVKEVEDEERNEERRRQGRRIDHLVASNIGAVRTDCDSMTAEIDDFQNRIRKLLPYPRAYRDVLHYQGCV
jgi:hypothetical protein